LNILASLDAAGFTLLASLSIAGIHHRIKDLWIFAGRDHQSPSISAYDTSSGQNPENMMPIPFVAGENHLTGLQGPYATEPAEEHQTDMGQDMTGGPLRQVPSKTPKHAVLKKKNHQQETSLAKSEDGQGGSQHDLSQTRADEISRQYDPVPKDPETPARVLYSTPHPQTTNPNGMDADPNLTLPNVVAPEPAETRDAEMTTGLATLGGTAVYAGAAEFGKPQDPNHNLEGDGFRNEQSENTHLTQAKEVGRPSDELLAEGVFRNTGYASSFEHQHSTGSIPLLSTQNQAVAVGSHPLIPPSEAPTQSETNASGERLKNISAVERPTSLKRQQTPSVPGGWLHTPAEEKKEFTNREENHPLPTPETQNVPNYKPQTSQSTGDRASSAGILGNTPMPDVLLDSLEEGDLKVDEAVNLKADDQVIPSSKVALEQAEAKVPPVMEDEKGSAEVPGQEPGPANDAENVEPLGTKTTPKRSVLKRIFHRQARSSSGSDGA
jgi:hypothetical protein